MRQDKHVVWVGHEKDIPNGGCFIVELQEEMKQDENGKMVPDKGEFALAKWNKRKGN